MMVIIQIPRSSISLTIQFIVLSAQNIKTNAVREYYIIKSYRFNRTVRL